MLYPTIPFETAIFSENDVSVSDETVQATTDYLLKATELNALTQIVQNSHFISNIEEIAGSRKLTLQFIYDQAKDDMPKIVEKLKKQIEKEQNWIRRLKRFVKLLKK